MRGGRGIGSKAAHLPLLHAWAGDCLGLLLLLLHARELPEQQAANVTRATRTQSGHPQGVTSSQPRPACSSSLVEGHLLLATPHPPAGSSRPGRSLPRAAPSRWQLLLQAVSLLLPAYRCLSGSAVHWVRLVRSWLVCAAGGVGSAGAVLCTASVTFCTLSVRMFPIS